ncbi:hypothetical protein DV451_002680 [Geotrichum candidum]|uniref:Mtf2-like C-terminal domain-containing protein n=1 Tax=Geotrichum candidum TaxID=1173061 RepID=A0A9P5G578_GEOCN|nr:hypothetical protein DV451_002680 [Geotrichum candidum]KAF5106548.1 hypothetical protein DV453_003868 [Geotrichum candidum]
MNRLQLRQIAKAGSKGIHRYFNSARILRGDAKDDLSWDFLANDTTDKPERNSDDFKLKTEFDDLYARPSSRPDAPLSKTKIEVAVLPETDAGASNEELDNVFRPRRRMADTQGVAGVTATQKEREIFSQIFDSILARSTPGTNKATTNKPAMSNNMQAFFEKTLVPNSPNNIEEKDVALGMTTEDVRKYPLSMSSLLLSQQKDSGKDCARGSEFMDALEKKLAPVYAHMDAFETDVELFDYYVDRVIASYTQQHSGAKGGKRKSKPEISLNTLEDVEKLEVSATAPPVVSRTLPLLLVKSMQLMMSNFNSPDQALALFELSKKQGIDFYVAACNIDVYNEALRIRWETYRDLYQLETLVSEIDVNGLNGDSVTSDVLSSVDSYYSQLKIESEADPDHVTLWSQEEEERLNNLNVYRLKIARSLVKQNVQFGQKDLFSLLSPEVDAAGAKLS